MERYALFLCCWKKRNPSVQELTSFLPFQVEKLVPYRELISRIEEETGNRLEKLNDAPNETAKSYRLPGHAGTVSFITSMTEHFCSSCNRLRITADGNLKVCLFGSSEVSLRDMLRQNASEEDLMQTIASAVRRKKASHAGMYTIAESKNRPMILIGG